jgi:protein gp37
MNNVKDSIGWADYTWNPITGCRRGCPYCYAKRVHDRFWKHIPFEDIRFHPERLDEPKKLKRPSKIFVGSMSDPSYWDPKHVAEVYRVIEACPQHTFMFLSKDYFSYNDWGWLENAKFGMTITQHTGSVTRRKVENFLFLSPVATENLFISVEPLLGVFEDVDWFDHPGMIIVGAMTGPGATKPEPEWIQSIIDNFSPEQIYWKRNIRHLLPDDVRASLTDTCA